MSLRACAALLAVAVPSIGFAAQPSPYVDQTDRHIKALAPAEVQSLLAGRGMGYAKAAELNGYPGPAHVLELALALELTEQQRERSAAIHTRMETAAKALGAQIVAAEKTLDDLFSSKNADQASVRSAIERIADLQGQLRSAHLLAHLEQSAVLTPPQIARYIELRGYGKPRGDMHHRRHHGGHESAGSSAPEAKEPTHSDH